MIMRKTFDKTEKKKIIKKLDYNERLTPLRRILLTFKKFNELSYQYNNIYKRFVKEKS